MGPAARRLHPPSAVMDPILEQLMSKLNDLSRSLVPIAVIRAALLPLHPYLQTRKSRLAAFGLALVPASFMRV